METAEISSADSRQVAKPRPQQRSRVGNGNKLLAGIDGRSVWVRRLKDVLAEAISDRPDMSSAELHILRRACVLVALVIEYDGNF
jgi:hypothetical protein